MRLREQEMPLDPEIERELAAIEAGLAGLEVEPELEPLAELARETRGMRALPDPGFTTELDGRAAQGFVREGPLAHPGARIAAIPPRRVLLPVGAAATLLVVVGVGISQLGGASGGGPEATSLQAPGGSTPPPTAQDQTASPSAASRNGPTVASGGEGRQERLRAPLGRLSPATPTTNGGLVPNRSQRKVESNAQLTLGADSDQVPDVADGVVEVTHRYDGIIVSSQVTHGDSGAHASFDLAIPSAQLQAALADLSGLAHIQSSSEGSIDITAPTVAAHERIAALAARLADLRSRLAAATANGDTSAQSVIKQKIQYVQSVLRRSRNRSDELRKRADISRVSVTVSSDGGTIAGSGGWTFDDAIHDAGRVLAVTAGVLLVTAAVLGPLALLAVLAWAASRALLRWRRERSLDQAPEG
jgi:Domain of unknown function (DUF4349)